MYIKYKGPKLIGPSFYSVNTSIDAGLVYKLVVTSGPNVLSFIT